MPKVSSKPFLDRGTDQKGSRSFHINSNADCNIINNAKFIKTLRREAVAFQKEKGLTDLTKSGFRMVIDLPFHIFSGNVNFISGDGSPCVNPQDWRTKTTQWDPSVKAPFFELSTEAAKARLEKMKFGNTMYYPYDDSDVFGVSDGDPKADEHFLMLASPVFRTMADDSFTESWWIKFMQGAYKIIRLLGLEKRGQVRIVANCGNGFQNGPRVHMHVLWFEAPHLYGYIPYIFPQQYGFLVDKEGMIQFNDSQPRDRRILQYSVMQLIDKRKTVEGFTEEARAQRKAIDKQISMALHKIVFPIEHNRDSIYYLMNRAY